MIESCLKPIFFRNSRYKAPIENQEPSGKQENSVNSYYPLNNSTHPLNLRNFSVDYRVLLTVFGAVFIAELGDKTQLATMLFAADKEVSKFTVFVGSSLALIVASAIGVLAGGLISEYISEKLLHTVAGIGFIGIGLWTLLNH